MTLPALVLCAGLGTRLDPLTRIVAKAAVPLGDRTLIERVLGWLASHDIRRVVVNLHHRPDTITAVVGDGAHLGMAVRYSWEQPLLGSAGGPRHALPLLDARTFLVVNGDTLCDVDLAGLVDAHVTSGADVTMAVVPNTRPDHYNGIATDAALAVTGFVPRRQAEGSWHFVGIQVVNASVFAPLADGAAADTVPGLYPALIVERPGCVRVWPTSGRFIDVGTPRDYLSAALQWSGRERPLPPGVTRSVVWPGVTFGARVVIDECVVLGGLHVPDGFRARRAILAPDTLRGSGDRVDERAGVAIFPLA